MLDSAGLISDCSEDMGGDFVLNVAFKWIMNDSCFLLFFTGIGCIVLKYCNTRCVLTRLYNYTPNC